MIPNEMREIFEEFLVEARENLEKLETDLLELEKDPTNQEILNSAFRVMHTIKGGAGFLGLDPIVETAHKAEDILGKLRNAEFIISPAINDLLLKAADKIKEYLEKAENQEELEPDNELLSQLEDVLKNPDKYSDKYTTINKSATVSDQSVSSKEKEAKPQIGEKNFEESSDDPVSRLLKKYGFEHLIGKSIEEILEELVLMPPSERPEGLIQELDALINGTSSKSTAESSKKEEEIAKDKIATSMPRFTSQMEAQVDAGAQVSHGIVEPPKQAGAADTHSRTQPPKEKEEEKVLRIDVQKIEVLMNLVGELVLDRNRLVKVVSTIMQSASENNEQIKGLDDLESVLSSIDRIVGDLQVAVMKTRMQPVKRLFQKFPRVVRDLAKLLNKQIELVTEGEDTEMDKSVLEKLEEPLIHIIRNSVDHGIESPEERELLGKPRNGIIKLKAYYQGDRIIMVIEDDGRGIDIDKVKRKALEKGIISQDRLEKMTEKEVLSLIFHPGFSTADQVSEVSGRGVGMDVVMTTVMNFRGTIDIETQKGKGTKVTMAFPLTVGIIRALMVSIGNRNFAIPIYSVLEIIQQENATITTVSGEDVLILRESTIPLVNLADVLGIRNSKIGYVIISQLGNQRVSFTVEELYGDEEIVVKPLGKIFGEVEGISGATITGDGNVVLILDLAGILKRITHSARV
ncbi:CheA signal transduction histidine kinase [Hydrogenobaculum sp. Y04AAS1]|uniref:chemotaxis protein CheW n=1 Tax=Hydrogenobaculum sp. (strain Y04AAS1) TaxID=380749 RepID=UPI00015BD321|nr:CheA signal transduction histidine kinase [Hydrogenobaculum sp. Y04AAS1]HCT67171.1 chemotaxis protein CheA [Hydrogenobaculum sp.]